MLELSAVNKHKLIIEVQVLLASIQKRLFNFIVMLLKI